MPQKALITGQDGSDLAELVISLDFQGAGLDEQGIVTTIADPEIAPALQVGDCIVCVDPRYFRPAEVETLLGDPTYAREDGR